MPKQSRVERDGGLESRGDVVAWIRVWYESSFFVLVRGKRGVVSPADDAWTCFGFPFTFIWQGGLPVRNSAAPERELCFLTVTFAFVQRDHETNKAD